MRIYKTQEEVEKDIKNNVLDCNYEDVTFECDINIKAHIINARNISAWDLNAWNINAWDINAWDVNAWDITYNAFLIAYQNIKCKSYKAEREIHKEPICLNGKLEIKKEIEELTLEEVCKELGRDIKIIK